MSTPPMPAAASLSILVPVVGDVSRLETTLVSVLSHRPVANEVVVALAAPYDDPYDLGDEVRFVDAPHGASWTDTVNAGLAACRGEVVHLLDSGLEVEQGWTSAALVHFDRAATAAVAPWIVDAAAPQRVVAAGVEYTAGGRRQTLDGHQDDRDLAAWRTRCRGPHRGAGFYRRRVLVDLLHGLDASVSESWIDANLAVRLRQAGFAVAVEPGSRVLATESVVRSWGEYASAVRRGYQSERMFWRQLTVHGWLRSLAAHAGVVLFDTLAELPRLAALGLLAGRAAGLVHVMTGAAERAKLRGLAGLAAHETSASVPGRVDRAGGLRGAHRSASVAVDALRESA